MARGRVYTMTMDAVTVSATQDLFTIQAALGVPIEIHACEISQKTLTSWEAHDVTHKYTATATVTGGTSVTARPMLPNDAAASATCHIANPTVATGASTVTLMGNDWIFLNGYYWSPAGDDDRIVIKGGDAWSLRLGSAPSGATVCSGWVSFAELV